MTATSRHFSDAELRCTCGCGVNGMQQGTVDRLQRVRDQVGVPLVVSSGYRCPTHNAAVSHTGTTGPHTTGHAVDLAVRGPLAVRVLAVALQAGFCGVGVSQRGAYAGRFLHLDDCPAGPACPRPAVWSY